MTKTPRLRCGVAAAALLTLLAAGCTSSGSTSGGHTTPRQGGTITYALPPNEPPDYIFPLTPLAHFTIVNFTYFINLMYRPLYWFGKGDQPTLNEKLSLAKKPVFSDHNTKVTIALKDYKWSDGSPVDASSVLFWMHLLKAEKGNWGAYVPGSFPDNVKSMHVDGPHQVTFTLDDSYSDHWFTYNELSQITPLPEAWDRTASGPAHCATNPSDCKAVYKYLAKQAGKLKSYATNKLWQVVDGPWRLKAFNPDGHTTFVPNRNYSGTDKPRIDAFKLLPFTSDTAEYNVLRAGKTLSVGYASPTDLPPKPPNSSVGRNPLKPTYKLKAWPSWDVKYFQFNYNNPTVGPLFHQLYIRQALQHLVNQKGVIKSALHGYGFPTYGPVPNQSSNPYASSAEQSNPYPFSVGTARKLLTKHGWKVTPDGTTTCAHPGKGPNQCGAGIKAGQPLEFLMQYWSGVAWGKQAVQDFKSNAAKAGIVVKLKSGAPSAVVGDEVQCKPSQSSCTWQIGEFNWLFDPDFYPTGGELWGTGAGSNPGSYSDPRTDKLITRTHRENSIGALKAYENYLATQVPDLWWPAPESRVAAIKSNVRGVTPLNPLLSITPEDWYLVK